MAIETVSINFESGDVSITGSFPILGERERLIRGRAKEFYYDFAPALKSRNLKFVMMDQVGKRLVVDNGDLKEIPYSEISDKAFLYSARDKLQKMIATAKKKDRRF